MLKDVEVYKGEELYKGVSICEEIKTLAEEPRKKNTDDSNITHRVRGSEKSSENPKVFWSYMWNILKTRTVVSHCKRKKTIHHHWE